MKHELHPYLCTKTITQNIKITYKGYYQCYQIIIKQETVGQMTSEEKIYYKTNLRKSTFHNIYTYIKQYIFHKKRQQELLNIIKTIDYLHNTNVQSKYYDTHKNSTEHKLLADIQYTIEVKTTNWSNTQK